VKCTIYEKRIVYAPTRMPLADAVDQYLGGDWNELIPELAWPPLDELLAGAPTIPRSLLRQRLVTFAAETATRRLNDTLQESASDEAFHELALDGVALDADDLAALDAHLGAELLDTALAVYGQALADRLTEAPQ